MKEFVRFIPPIHELQKDARFSTLTQTYGIDRNEMSTILKNVVSRIREQLLSGCWEGELPASQPFIDDLFQKTEYELKHAYQYTIKRVINATGTILHTNLGRARLSQNAMNHVIQTAQHYSNLEYMLAEGERGSRHAHVEELIIRLTGAEAAMVVNNNAAAVFLILRALAFQKEVIVSRGQLVEIGGSFRISSIMEESGAQLVEVGTTNKTHLYDFENAVSEDTAMIMKVHTSNFKVIGFTKSVETSDLVDLANRQKSVIYYEDLGSGALYDYSQHGIGEEPVVSDVLNQGVDIVSFSGDKLLGGPQAGIIAGKKILINQLKKHQLARVLRVDKMTLAALEGTLLDYSKGKEAIQTIPVVRDLLATEKELQIRTNQFIDQLLQQSRGYTVTSKEAISQVGGGTMPDVELPTVVVQIKSESMSAETLANRLRTENTPPIVARIHKEELIVDLRTVTVEEESIIIHALVSIDRMMSKEL
ncbi:L-seryl-tRNA(Sec) selenium transferase [Robertmurraya korlensis]|uniref:L-seryl-tRNA(Sec) selenium transferase n=1 Tax=Robertmurraya korlensis TaxID=519977 RepID=UPI00203B19CD|nr:L-seryl-tRNA(Sec) selenium transferase [Robertmurraya korlensis]MCM3601439.1 L-seryl-tRNA(Sec) selenium transferase [Robertmurraya korlensis]